MATILTERLWIRIPAALKKKIKALARKNMKAGKEPETINSVARLALAEYLERNGT